MKKPALQDVVVKSPRNSPSRSHSTQATVASVPPRGEQRSEPQHTPPPHRPHVPTRRARNGGVQWLVIAVLLGLVVIALAFFASLFFSGATVTVHPRTESTSVSAEFVLTTEPLPGQLGFERVSFEKTAAREVDALSEEEVEERASGQLTIQNTYSSDAQRLIKRTRFKAPNGNIYRIQESVDVPGFTVASDGSRTPGEVTVVVYADEAGESYNIEEPSTFVIAAWDDTERGRAFKVNSNGPIEGGFSGLRRTVDEETRAAVVEELKSELRDTLRAEAFASGAVPEDHILFNDALHFEYVPQADENTADGSVRVRQKAILHGILFNKEELAEFLAAKTLASYDNNPVELRDYSTIDASVTELTEEEEDVLPWTSDSLRAQITGTAEFIWLFDAEQLEIDLLGRDKSAMPTILSGYPGIERAEAVLRPFWKSTFPEDRDDITILSTLDSE